MGKVRFDAALEKLKTYSQTDPGRIAAIGYCFGGTQALNMADFGEDLKGVVCHGGDDQFTPQPQVDQFKKEMDSVGAKYIFTVYEGATHAFTNPAATENGKKFGIPIAYNAAADTASWKEMKDFLGRVLK